MSVDVASIASGSNGNCYYVGNENEAILVDAGISCREIEKRMLRMGLQIRRVKAILISHEHGDHIRGLSTLANKYQIPVYIHEETRACCKLAIPERLIRRLLPGDDLVIGALEVTTFLKYHDAAAPVSFVVRQYGLNIGVFTDIGRICNQMIHHFSQCHVAFLEANYEKDLLENGKYPHFLKRRISGGLGHLSNQEAWSLFDQYRGPHLQLLLLSHLSKDNNDPQLVQSLFQQIAGDTEVVVAGREAETAVYNLAGRLVDSLDF